MGKTLKQSIGEAFKAFRIARGRNQESAGVSQSYMSLLEAGGRWNVSVAKVDEIATALEVHPLSIIAAAYRIADPQTSRKELLKRIETELNEVGL